MVQKIEYLGPEIEPHPLAPWQKEMLDSREVGIHKARAGDRRAGCVSQFAGGRVLEAINIEPLANRGVAQYRVANLVRTDQAVSIVFEVDPRVIVSHHKNRKPGGGLLDRSHLPISQYRVDGAVPVAAEGLAFAERQFIDHAGWR